MTENAPAAGWEEHDHEGLVHARRHFRVTHNHNEMTGGFEHLSAAHEHEHDHAPLRHAHVPHRTSTARTPAGRTSMTTTSRPRREAGLSTRRA